VKRLVLLLTIVSGSVAGGCSGCPTALLTGVLAEQAGELVVLDGGGQVHPVTWPEFHSVSAEGDTLVLTNVIGAVVAREGDTVRLGGGEIDPERPGAFEVCGQLEVTE
jgi:hypothetical protein